MEFTSLLKGPYDTRLLPAPWASIYRQLRQPCQAIRSGVVRMVRIVMSLSDLPKHGFVFRYDREKHKVEAAFWGPGVIFVLGLVGVIFALWARGLLSPMRLQSFDGRSHVIGDVSLLYPVREVVRLQKPPEPLVRPPSRDLIGHRVLSDDRSSAVT